MVHNNQPIMTTRRAALVLGIPRSWLEAEITEGRLPHLRVGRKRTRIVVDVEHLRRALQDRADRERNERESEATSG